MAGETVLSGAERTGTDARGQPGRQPDGQDVTAEATASPPNGHSPPLKF